MVQPHNESMNWSKNGDELVPRKWLFIAGENDTYVYNYIYNYIYNLIIYIIIYIIIYK